MNLYTNIILMYPERNTLRQSITIRALFVDSASQKLNRLCAPLTRSGRHLPNECSQWLSWFNFPCKYFCRHAAKQTWADAIVNFFSDWSKEKNWTSSTRLCNNKIIWSMPCTREHRWRNNQFNARHWQQLAKLSLQYYEFSILKMGPHLGTFGYPKRLSKERPF